MKRRRKPAIDWREVAGKFVARIDHTQLHPAAMERAFAESRRERRRGLTPARWALALSGGADSLALLLLFWAEGPGRWGREFVAMHFNHRLRGQAAVVDEKFCRSVCAALGITFVAGRWTGQRRGASEAEARAARFAFFEREMRRRRLRLLWLAHQADDVAETMLMRLARGSATSGLAAPRPVQEMGEGMIRLRPLLTLQKRAIIAALRSAGATWCEDATNAGDNFFRNRIRQRVLPAWQRAAGRDAVAGALLSRELLEEDDTALQTWLEELQPVDRYRRLLVTRLAGKPRALFRRALHRWLLAVRPETDLSRQGFNQLLRMVEAGRDSRFSLGRQGFAVLRAGLLSYRTA